MVLSRPTNGRTGDRVFHAGVVLLGVLVVPIVLLTVGWSVFHWRGFWQVAAQPLATLGATAGVLAGALVAYHGAMQGRSLEKQRLLADRKQRLHDRFSDIAAHLSGGSESRGFDRIARVHALAALCDDWGALRGIDPATGREAATQQQVCVDLFKEMIRQPQPDDDRLADLTQRSQLSAEQHEDLAIRQTIVEIIHTRLNGDAGADWGHLDCSLRYSRLRWARFHERTLAGLDLRNAVLDRADFTRSTLIGVDLAASSARFANFERANLRRCILRSTWLRGARFVDADLTGARLDNAQLYETRFDHADLSDASLAYATTELVDPGQGARTVGLTAYTDGVRPVKYHLPDRISPGGVVATFNEARFHGADLRHARLVHADACGAHFCHAQLQGTDFTASYLVGAVVVRAQLGGERRRPYLPASWEGLPDWPTLLPLGDNALRGAVFYETDLRTHDPGDLTRRGAELADPMRLFSIHSRCYGFRPAASEDGPSRARAPTTKAARNPALGTTPDTDATYPASA